MRDTPHSTPEPSLVVGILGRVRATADGRELDLGGPRQRALLALLAVEVGRTVPTDTLIDAVWDGDPPDAADRTFRTYVSRLRKALGQDGVDGAEVVLTDASGYRLDEAVAAVDADLFEDEVAAARARLAAGQAAVAAGQLADALERWEGRALGAFADRVWAAPSSVRLEEQRRVAEELYVRALLDADRTAGAATRIEELAAAEPLRESVARLHALALYRSGRDADALRVTREFRERLADEHGLDPSAQLAELEAMILDRDPRLDRSVGGRRLRGYVLHEPVARSPLGTVHRAEQPSIGREVAITVLPPERADDPDVVRAFEARVQAVAGLEHPHVLPIYDYWREPGGAYVVTRFPAGGTLAQHLRRGALDAERALKIGAQVGDALTAAHEAGVAHGDLGPDAVVVDDRGDAFVWGFSLEGGQHARRDVAALARLVATATTDGAGEGAVRTAALPPPAAAAIEQALDPSGDGIPTVAGLTAAFEAARTGGDGPAVAPVEVGPNPYRGLAAFREADAAVFFGRDELIGTLQGRVARTRAVAVVGPSGSGKSSVVRAGLLPRLRVGGAFVTTMVPGTRPLAELEVALSRVAAIELAGVADEIAATPAGLGRVVHRALPTADGDLVLVVDQFEELFTISEPSERDLLLTALSAAAEDPAGRIRVVVTVRADFLGRVLSHPTAGPLVRDRSVMVTPLTDDELHEVVVGPAEVAGVAVEPALATAIVADATRAPGSLPMVQFALTEVFAAADDGTMMLAAYRRIGGIEGVLGQRAEEVYAGLDETGQRAAQQLFERLVVPNTDGPPTRRRALRSEFSHVPDGVIDAFGRARLLRFDNDEQTREPTLEVTHEALFRAWPRLVAWIEEGEDDLRTLGHLTIAAHEWDEGGRAEADLYRGNRLDAAMDFADGRRSELSDVERTFLDASRARRARDAEADRRTVRRLRMLTAGLGVGLVVALIAGTLAAVAQREEAAAREELAGALSTEEATARQAQGDALAFAASKEVEEDPERASLLAAEAFAFDPDLESQAALLDVLDVDPRITSLLPTPSDSCGAVSGSAETVAFATLTPDGPFIEIRTLDQEVLRRMPDPAPGGTSCIVTSPTTDHLIGRSADRGYTVWDLDTMEVVAERSDVASADDQNSMSLHPTRPEAVLVLDTGEIAMVALPTLETTQVLDLDLDAPEAPDATGRVSALRPVNRAVTHSEDGTLVAVADTNTVHVVDAEDGTAVATVAAAPHPDGFTYPFVSSGAALVGYLAEKELVVTSLDAADSSASAPATRSIALGAGSTPYAKPVAVEPGGMRVAVATEDGVVVVDLADGTTVGTPLPVDSSILELVWPAPGRLAGIGPNGVLQADVDRTLTLGALSSGAPVANGNVRVADDGSGYVVDVDEQVRFVDAATGDEFLISTPESRLRAAPVDGGRWLAADRATGEIRVGDASGVTATRQLEAARIDVPAFIAIAVEGPRTGVAMAGIDGSSVGLVLDSLTGEPLAELEPADEAIFTVVPITDDLALVAYESYAWATVDRNGEIVDGPRVLGVGREVAAVAPSGDRYATGDFNGDLNVVDIATNEVIKLVGSASFVVDVAFVDDDRLVSRHADGSTYLWDVAEAGLVGRLWRSGTFDRGFGLGVDTGSEAVVQVTQDGIARIPLDPNAWLEAVCERVNRPLTDEEVAAVVPGHDLLDPCGEGSDDA